VLNNMKSLSNERVLITGGAGYLGRGLANAIKNLDCEILLASRSQSQLAYAEDATGCPVKPCDITSVESLNDTFREFCPTIVIHAAAAKFVGLTEREPLECIDTNVVGSRNVARASIAHSVRQVIGISSDKAAAPATTTYGLTKSLMERMFCRLDGTARTRFSAVRLGNIAWSTGSVFPIWKQMQMRDGVIHSTGSNMRRFFMTRKEAANFVLQVLLSCEQVSGSVVVPLLKAAEISNILDVWTRVYGGTWERSKPREGDSLDQWLIGDSERIHTQLHSVGPPKLLSINFAQTFPPFSSSGLCSNDSKLLSEAEIEALIFQCPDQP